MGYRMRGAILATTPRLLIILEHRLHMLRKKISQTCGDVTYVVLLQVPPSTAGPGSCKATVMAIEGSQRILGIFIALSLPPVAMLFMAFRRSKRSDENIPAAHDHDGSFRRTEIFPSAAINTSPGQPYCFVRFEQRPSIKASPSPRMNLLAPAVSLLIVATKLRPAPATFVTTYPGAGVIMTVRPQLSASQPRQRSSNARGACVKRRMPRSYLEGKVVWITGASSGLGEQLALAAAAGGAEGVILSGRRVAELERVQRACEKARPDNFSSVGGVRLLPFDVGDLEFVEKEAAPRALKEFGRVDTLVLNAGVSTRGSVVQTSLEVDKRVMAVNYFGAMGLAKGLLAARAKPPAGAAAEIEKSSLLERPTEACVSVTGSKVTSGIDFVVINSVQGKFGVPFRSSYAASKHALLGFFDCLRAEETHRGVRVTSVFPGYIRTSLSMNALTADGKQHARMDSTTAAGRDPREVSEEIWKAVARGREELIVSDLKTNVAVLLRALVPRLLFEIMAKRGRKSDALDRQ